MKVTIRMDDITPDMNWKNFNKAMEILQKNQIMPLLGIVPENHDPMLSICSAHEDFAEEMNRWKDKGAALAMHGATHVYQTQKAGLFPLNCFSEFAGVPYGEQERKLREAKQKLDQMGIQTDIFMAPGHTFDCSTVEILKKLGFSYLTDGFGTQPYERLGMIFLPIALQKNKVFQSKEGISTIVLHVNQWETKDFDDFEKMITEKKAYFVSYKEWFQASVKKQRCVDIIKEYIAAKGKWFLVLVKTKLGR